MIIAGKLRKQQTEHLELMYIPLVHILTLCF